MMTVKQLEERIAEGLKVVAKGGDRRTWEVVLLANAKAFAEAEVQRALAEREAGGG